MVIHIYSILQAFEALIVRHFLLDGGQVEEKPLSQTLSRELDLHYNIGLRTGRRVSDPVKGS